MDRLNARNILILKRKRHRLEGNNYSCVPCDGNVEETAFHLFFSCPFSQRCWQHLGIQWNLAAGFFQMMVQAKQQFQSPFSWKSSPSPLGKFGSKEMTQYLIEEGLLLIFGRFSFLRGLNFRPIDFLMRPNELLFFSCVELLV
jgi:hypothetical protein